MKEYTRGVWDTLVYVLEVMKRKEKADVVEELLDTKARLKREASKDFKARIKTL